MASPPQRQVSYRYEDPLDLIWLECVHQLGWQVKRSHDVFASWNGAKTLTLGRASDLDLDDHLGQLILHELCHALIEGESGEAQVDWGLENIDSRHLVNELACHRLQAFFADRINARSFFAVTTDWRPYYDQIPSSHAFHLQTQDQLSVWSAAFQVTSTEGEALDREAVELALQGEERSRHRHWFTIIDQALERTHQIRSIIRECSPPHTLWSTF